MRRVFVWRNRDKPRGGNKKKAYFTQSMYEYEDTWGCYLLPVAGSEKRERKTKGK